MVTRAARRMRARAEAAPVHGDILARQLWHLDRPERVRLTEAIEAAFDEGMGVDLNEGDGPVFYEAKAPLIGAPSSLGGLCALVNDTIRDHFETYGLRPPTGLRTAVTTGAMVAGGYDAALAYLMRWVAVETEDD